MGSSRSSVSWAVVIDLHVMGREPLDCVPGAAVIVLNSLASLLGMSRIGVVHKYFVSSRYTNCVQQQYGRKAFFILNRLRTLEELHVKIQHV
jgi:hypothetical protein